MNLQQVMKKMFSVVVRSATVVVIAFAASSVMAKDMPGATQTSYGVSASGAFSFNIPIVVPSGRNGVQPSLSLGYSSGGGNGSVGVGWGVSGLGSITRCGRTIATDGVKGGVLHDQNDKYCLNGQRLIMVNGSTYGAADTEYRTEIDSFAKVVAKGSRANLNGGSSPLYWEVWSKGGMIQEYGNSESSRFVIGAGDSIHAWRLSKSKDRFDNHYAITYQKEYRIPSTIIYQGGHEITFNYEDRTDVRSAYILGEKITRNRRLESVVVKKGATLIREYNLAYEYAALTEKSKLTSVTECGQNNECMPPIAIDWKTDAAGLASTSVAGFKAKESTFLFDTASDNLNREITKGAWADVNGDGRIDQIIAYRGRTGGDILKTYLQTVDSNGNIVWVEDAAFDLPKVLRDYSRSIMDASFNNFNVVNQGQLVDVDGDGLVDVVYAVEYQWYDQSDSTTKTKTIHETWINKGNDDNPANRKGWALDTAYNLPGLISSYKDNSGSFTHYKGSECSQGCQYSGFVETRRGRFVDIDGDGLVDWVQAYHRWNGSEYKATWTNNGSGWDRNSTYDMPDVFAEYRGLFSLQHGALVDVNGDGRVDWVQSHHANTDTTGAKIGTWLNTENGFVPAPSEYNLPNMLYENLSGWDEPRVRGSFIDVNGDGRRDFVLDSEGGPGGPGSPQDYYGATNKTWLNTGNGWVYTSGYNVPFEHKNHRYIGHTGQTGNQAGSNWPMNTNGFYIDMNRDGLVDFAQSYKDVFGDVQEDTWINTGVGWTQDNSFNTGQLFYDYSGRKTSKVRFGTFLDINTDGTPDWVKSRGGEASITLLSETGKSDQISKITTTLGVEIQPTFATLSGDASLYQKGVGASEADSRHITGPSYVVSNLTTPSGNGLGNNITEYVYSGAQVHRKGRGFLGFKTFQSTNLATAIRSKTTFRQDYPFTGRAIESVVSEAAINDNSKWLSKTTNQYAVNSLNSGKTRFPYLSVRESRTAELDTNGGAQYQWSRSSNYYLSTNYGQLDYSFTEAGPDETTILQTTRNDYQYHAANLPNWLIGQVQYTTTTTTEPNDASTTEIRKNKYEYYSVTGALHKQTREPDSTDTSIKLITTYAYDAYGNVQTEEVASTDSAEPTRTNTIGYDSDHRLPISLTNALNQESTIVYHDQCDAPEFVTSIDGQTITSGYDNFCRQVSVTDAASVSQTTSYNYPGAPVGNEIPTGLCGSQGCDSIPRFSVTSQLNQQPAVTAFFNLYAQPFLSVTEGMNVGQVIHQKTEYDSLGRVERQSQPFFQGDLEYWTENEYDLLGRVTKVTLPYGSDTQTNATITNSFSVDASKRQERTTNNTLNNTKTVFANALGQIDEIQDAYTKSLTYDYDSRGNLIKTTDASAVANNIIVKYDDLDRRTELNDPDLGIVSYTYDAFSQQRTQTDAKNQTLSTRYDVLGRIKERDVPLTSDPSSPIETSYFYYDDPTVNAIGKLSKVVKGNGPSSDQQDAMHYGYDNYGRPNTTISYIKGQRFAEAITYNSDGQLETRAYPASGAAISMRFAVEYKYKNGYLETISGIDDTGVVCIEHWRADEYDALGRTKQDTLGDIISTTRTYDPAQGVLKKIQSIVTVGAAGTVQDIDYIYDANNNLTSRNDQETGVFDEFVYDQLDRLRYTNQGNSDEVEVQYDDIGNITYKSDVGAYKYNGQGGPHAVSRVDSPLGTYDPLAKFAVDWEWNGETITQPQANITDTNYEYDVNGNITKQGNRTVSWTTFDKPASMMLESGGVKRGSLIEYNALFERNYKVEGELATLGSLASIKEETYYVGKEYEKIISANGDIKHRYTISTGGGVIQVERADGSVKDEPKYLLGDNLGSTNVIVNASGELVQRLAFDPWGARTNVAGFSGAVNGETNRGYTGHETDDEVGLVNMNARIYDPVLGRFLSADSLLQAPYNLQSFNRYSYVFNNPLKYTDPTGHASEPTEPCKADECKIPDSPNNEDGPSGSGSSCDEAKGHNCSGIAAPRGAAGFTWGTGWDTLNHLDRPGIGRICGGCRYPSTNSNATGNSQTTENTGDEITESGGTDATAVSTDTIKVPRPGSRLTRTLHVVNFSNDLVVFTTAEYLDAVSSGKFVFDTDGVDKTFSLAYFGNQYHSAQLIRGLKSGNLAVARIGTFAGKVGSALSVINTGLTLVEYRSGNLSGARTTLRLSGTAIGTVVGAIGGPLAGLSVGLVFAGSELGYDLVHSAASYTSSNIHRPGFIRRINRSFGVIPGFGANWGD